MMNLTRLMLSVSLIAFLGSTQAKDDTATALQTKLATMQNYEADFTQTVTDVSGEVLQESAGVIKLKQPNQLYWEALEPNEVILIADGKTLWQIDAFMEQVIAMDQDQAISNNPMILLTNPQSDAWQNFSISRSEDNFIIESNSTESHVSKLVLEYTGITLTGLQIHDRQEQVNKLTFNSVKQNQNIEKSVFSYSVPSGYDLDDQRSQ